MAGIQGGFDCEFVEKPPIAFQSECPVCLQVLREPYQASCCGYSFCRMCIERIKVRNFPCPCCKTVEFSFFQDKRLQRSLYEFKVKCTNKDQGCLWVGELGQLDNHLNLKPIKDKQLQGCQFAQVQCLYCTEPFQRSNIQVHQNDHCLKRPFSCKHCQTFQSNYEDVTINHWPVCGHYPVQCPNKYGEALERHNLENHTANDCVMTDANIGSENFTDNTENRQQFEKAMKHGHVEAELGKMLVYGAAGSGKTSFKELVVGNAPPSSRESTPLAVRPTTMYRINLEGKEWATLKTLSERREFLARALIKCNPPTETQPTVNPAGIKRYISYIIFMTIFMFRLIDTTILRRPLVFLFLLLALLFGCKYYGCYWWHYCYWCLCCYCSYIVGHICIRRIEFEQQEQAYMYLKSLFTSSNIPNNQNNKRLFSTATDKRIIKQMDRLSARVDVKQLASFRMLQIIDSGGQPQFHEILPIFLHQLSFYVFVFRLCDDLGSRPEVEFYKNGKPIGKKYTSTQTTEQFLQHCVRTIQSQGLSKHECPQIIIIGTHVDKEDASNESRTVKNNKILKLLQRTAKNQITYRNMVAKKVIFPLNAKKPGQKEQRIIEQIRQALLNENSLPKADIPLKWYALEILLEEMAIALRQGILRKQECFMAAIKKLHFNANAAEFEAALEYLSKLSVLFYYPKILPGVIFVDPQAILDKVTELVVVSFQMSEISEAQALTEEWRKFHEFALVTTELLSKKEFDKHYVPGMFEAKDLVDLFIKLLIFARFSETELFVPALLRNLDKNEISEYRTSSGPALVLQFPDGGPRQGLFCSLLCWLASPEYNLQAAWSISTDDVGVPVCLYRNCVKFDFPNSPATITLIDTYTHFEVHVDIPAHCTEDLCPKIYPTIKKQIVKGMQKAMLNLHVHDNSCAPIPALLCPCGMKEAHIATVNTKLGYWTCTICREETQCGKLRTNQLFWFEEQQVATNTRQLTEEHLSDLLIILRNYAWKWRDIGTHLGFQQGELENIAANQSSQPTSSQSCLRAMLSEWLQWTQGDSRGSSIFATLETLKSALRKSGLGATAQELSLKELQ